MTGRKRSRAKRLSDVNLIPKKEAIAYLERNMPSDINEAETTRSLITLIAGGLIDAGYQNGHVAYQARALDPFTVLVTIWSTQSEQEIKNMLPQWMKMKEGFEGKHASEPFVNQFIELFEKFSNQPVSEVKRIISEERKKLEEKSV